MVHIRKAITASTGWFLLLLLSGGCVTHPLGVRDPVAPTAFPEHDLVPLRDHACVTHTPFYGYNATCWRPWPQDWRGCPPQDPGMVIDEGTLLEDGIEIVDEGPSDDGRIPTLAPIPMPEDPMPEDTRPPDPLPPEIFDDAPPDNAPADPGSDATPDAAPEEDAAETIEADPVEVPTPASPQEPSQTLDQPQSEPVAVTVAVFTAEEATRHIATSNRVDVRFGNVVSMAVHDRSIAATDEAMPEPSASTQRVFHWPVQLILPFSPERAQPNRLAVFDTEKGTSDLEADEPAATQ